MKNIILNKISILTIAFSLISLSSAYPIADNNGPDNPDNITEKLIPQNKPGAQPPQYAPGEVLVKFKEGANPQAVLSAAGINSKSIGRVHSIASATAKFKKDYKLEKTSDGWYSYLGKNYKEIKEIPDTELFQEAYQQMPELEKSLYRLYKITIPEGMSVEEAVAKLKENPDVEYAQPDYIVKAMAFPQTLPNDTYVDPEPQTNTWRTGSFGQSYEDMWGLKNIKADKAWQIAQGEEVVVAVVDSGVDYNHPDLWDNIWVNPAVISDVNGDGKIDLNDCDLNHNHIIEANEIVNDMFGWDFANNDNNPMDGLGHGTHCAGTIAAVGNNAKGVIGVAPKARIMAVKGLSDQGGGYISDLAQCVKYAADKGAQVSSNSWGMQSDIPDPVFQDAFDYANAPDSTRPGNNKQGCVAVVAAGNSNMNFAFFSPANLAGVISVAAIDYTDTKAIFSNWGKVDVAAPGVEILSLRAAGTDMYLRSNGYVAGAMFVPPFDVNAQYYRASGTSMACPHAAGAAALLLSVHPEYEPQDVRLVLKSTVREVPALMSYFTPGFGVINVEAALQGTSNPLLRLRNCQFIDAGNRNGEFEPGENVNLVVELKALNQDASGVSVELRSTDPYVNILKGSSGYSAIPKGTIKDNAADPLMFNITSSCPLGRMLDFTLTISGNGNSKKESISVIVACAKDMKWVSKFEGINASSYPPVVEDIDKDERQEVIFILPGGAYGESQEGKICVVRSDGSNMPNWPIVPEPGKYNRISSFAVGDIDNDGYAEIVATRGRQKEINSYVMYENILYVYKYNGTTLPGFPITLAIDQYESGSVSLSDVNKDGYLDIVANFGTSALISRGFNRTKSLAAYDYKGRLIKRQMLEKQIFGGYLAIGDTNKDALPEIVLGSISNNAQYLGGLWLYDSNFKLVPGWPAGKDLCFQTSPTTIGNLDNNNKGNKQIVGYSLTNGNVQGGVHVFDKLGKQLFHKAIVPNPVAVEPILVDLDKDGDLEIVTTDAYGDVYGYHHDGTEVWEFPLVPEFLNINYPALDCQLVAGDIDADGYPEILLMTNDSLSRVALNAFKRDGTVVPGFPRVYSKNYIGLSIGGIALADLDGNGLVEIVCLLSDTYDGTSRRTYLGSLELPQPYQKNNMDWPMFRYDPQKTGCYRPAGSGVPIVPVKPENLVAKTISDSQINLSWTDKSNNEQGFKIERSTNNTTFSQIAVAGIDSNNYPDSGLIPGTRYYYRIKSYNAIGDAGYTIVVNATTLQIPPAAPTNLTATAVAGSNKNLTLSWTDNANNEQGFKVYHSADGTAFTQIGTVGAKAGTAGTATYAHNNLVPGSTHYYKILAYNLAGNSSYSNTAQISMPALNLPAAPSNLTATAATGSNKNLTLSWTDNANNEQGFKVYHSTDGTTFTQLTSVGAKTGTGATVTCPHNNLVPGSTHYYKVVAYNVDGNSSASNTAQITMPPLKPPAAPSNLSATAVTGSNRNLTLSWTDNANDEQGFKIQHSTDGTNFTQLSSVAAKTGTGQTVTLAHNNLVPGSTHYYKVVAFNVDGNSSASNTAQITMPPLNPPAAPSNLTATAVTGSKTSLALSWTDNASNEQGFKIQHSTNGTTFTQLTIVTAKSGTGATVTYTHNSLVSGSTHYYKIVAYNVDGDSAASNIASATVNR